MVSWQIQAQNSIDMIQRIQSVWLLAASVCLFGTLSDSVSFYIGIIPPEHFTAKTNVFILVLTVILATSSLIAIFLYKNRKLQFRISLGALLIDLCMIGLYVYQTKKYSSGGYSLTSVVVFVVPVCLFLAVRGIYKDQKLLKSVNRLR